MTRGPDVRPRGAGEGPAGIRDLNAGPVGRTLLLFSLPLMLSNLLLQANVVINSLWVSHLLGHGALAAIFNANLLVAFLIGCMSGLAMAANILIGQAVGARDEQRLRQIVLTCSILFLSLASIIAIGGAAGGGWLLELMQVGAGLRPAANSYLSIIFAAIPAMFLFSHLQMGQRSSGDARSPLYFSLLAVGLDIVLNPLLILGFGPLPRLGVTGSAMATAASQTVSLLLLVQYLRSRGSFLVPGWHDLKAVRPDLDVVGRLFAVGLPLGMTTMVVTASGLAMAGLVNRYGVATSAAYAAATQLWIYVQAPGAALGSGATALAAQAIGAGRWDKVDELALRGMSIGFAATLVPVAFIYAFNRQVMGLFLADPEAIAIAEMVNHHALWGFVLFSVSNIMTSIQRAAGAVLVPFVFIFSAMWLVRVPLAAVTSQWFGAEALWWSFPSASATVLICSAAYHRFGSWRPSSWTNRHLVANRGV